MASGTRKDYISELPLEIKERILDCLSTRDAARTALLSTHWKDVWLRHGRLEFDQEFLQCLSNCEGDKSIALANLINHILLLRVGPVKKFTLRSFIPMNQSDLDRWCIFLTRNNGVEELTISLLPDPGYRYILPVCIVLCPTIKILHLCGFAISTPVNTRCIFPSVTTLVFQYVRFYCDVKGIVFSIPKLEVLGFRACNGIEKFEISAPKLRSLSALGFMFASELRWFTVHLEAIKSLGLCGGLSLIQHVAGALTFPMAINLQVLKLYYFSVGCVRHFTFAMQLLKKFPNLCTLEIVGKEEKLYDDKRTASRILEDPGSYVINQNLEMLNTVKIESFRGSRLEMLFVKTMLSKSPSLNKVVIKELPNMDASMALNISRELLRFPRASPKAQLLFLGCNSNYSLIGPSEY